jgi:hypothetical protein
VTKGITVIRSLILLLDLLTNYQAVEALARDVFTFGLVNTGVACIFASFEIVRRLKLRRTAAELSRV